MKELSKRIHPINFGLLAFVFILLALKFQLIFKLKIGWDEFHYLSAVHTYLREGLTSLFQCFHVHFFTWLPAVSQNEVYQVIASRIILFFLFSGSCIFIYLIGKQILNKSGALFSVLCYGSLSNIIFHGVSFRPDSICSFFFLFSIYQIIKKDSSLISFILSGAAMALSLMISIKVQFHLLAIGGIFFCLFMVSENKKQTVYNIIIFAVTFIMVFLLLYFYHLSSLSYVPKTGALEYAGKAGSKVIMFKTPFPMLPFFVLSAYKNMLIWLLLFLGIAIISWERVRYKKWLCSAKDVCLLYCFLIPLLTLLIYRNAFPYYYVFIMAPAIIFCGVIMHKIAEDYQRTKARSYLFFAAVFSVAVFSNFLFHYNKATSVQLTAQKNIIGAVHEIFPEPVPYIDGCSVISSFPKVGLFMSTWGMENYLQAGVPIMADLLATRRPLFIFVNLPSLDFSLPRENPFTQRNYALMEEDWQVLKSNFIPHWGPIYVAGKKFAFDDETRSHDFEILIPGFYTIETKGGVLIDGTIYPSGSPVFLNQGNHIIERSESATVSVTLRWGKNLYRPEKEPELIPTFYGF